MRVTTWDDATVHAVAGLAMAGVPVVAESAAADGLSARLAAVITAPVDLDDLLAREEHSIVLRRAALDAYVGDSSSRPGEHRPRHPPARHARASRSARSPASAASTSLELVLAPHGFDPTRPRVRELLGPGVDLQVVPAAPSRRSSATSSTRPPARAGGDVMLKMDDDDWYAPDAIADLLRARAYSGAELVGMPAEFHYLEPSAT